VVHLHLGDGAQGLEPVRAALERSELPARVFHPTHVNRNPRLLDEAMQLAADPDPGRTPFVDLTAFAPEELGDAVAAADAMASWFARGLSADRLTCSSDGGGCMPRFDADGHVTGYGVGQASTLLQTVRAAVLEHGLALGEVLPVFTRNPATLLRLPGKGRIRAGADADLLVLASDLSLRATVAGGRFLVRDGRALVRGAFE
jgi:beta-aspartyl-dipeptidase (metallo-type)